MYKLVIKPLNHFTYSTLAVLIIMACSLGSFAQQTGRVIKGTVTDETNAPLPGAIVSVIGTNKSVSTDAKGAYAITINSNEDVLKFAFVGSVPKEVKAGTNDVLNITLVTDVKQLKDVVVIGYGTSSRSDVTGSITTIKSEDFNHQSLLTNKPTCGPVSAKTPELRLYFNKMGKTK